MIKMIKLEYFCNSKKWPRRLEKIKQISKNSIKCSNIYFNKKYNFYLNLILSNDEKMIELNKKYKKKKKTTDVLTFVLEINNKKLGKKKFCDIFFSADTIEKYAKKHNISFYEHFNHLLIHSFLHINGYKHYKLIDNNKMKKAEVSILKKLGIKNPYLK